jgi:hypothetical protein
MGRTKWYSGKSNVVCYHPEHSEIYCEIYVEWRYTHEPAEMYTPNGDGYPGSDDFEIRKCHTLTFCDQPVSAQDKECPEWIDWDQVIQEILDYELDDR